MPFDANDPETKEAITALLAEHVEPLKAHNKKLLGELKAAKKGTEVDPAEVERLENELEATRAKLADAEKTLKDTTKKAEASAKALEAEQKHTHQLLIENGLTAALTAAGVSDPDLLEGAAARIMLKHKPEVAVEGDARVAKIGDKALADFVKEWAQGANGKAYVAAPNHSGGGAAGSQGGAAKAWGELTMTEQGQLYKTNPAQAKTLAEQAGVTLS